MTALPQTQSEIALDEADIALLELLARLQSEGYKFVTTTPVTHARILSRPGRQSARDLRDILGWSLPFDPDLPDPFILSRLRAAEMIEESAGQLRSALRVSTLGNDLYLHSAYPTTSEDAVFFGPDSYRFANLIRHELSVTPPRPGAHIVDIGTGSGVGAIVAARTCRNARVTMTDINVKALRFARLNALFAGIEADTGLGAHLPGVDEPIDIALANPPYIIDNAGRAYRDGGEMHGGSVALAMAGMAVARLAPGGRLILYTGSAIVNGADHLADALADIALSGGCAIRYRELDPDIFGEELERAEYEDVERIALVAAVFDRSGASA